MMLALVVVSQGGDPRPVRALMLLAVLGSQGIYAAGWLAAAGGWGWALGRLLGRGAGVGIIEQVALGVGTLAMLDWLLGWAGWLNQITVWILCAIGWALLAAATFRRAAIARYLRSTPLASAQPTEFWPALLAIPAAALMLGAACIAPGILWQPTEAGGYDALEYHLQLPVEWASGGAIRGLEHNAYSWLPGLFEAAYTHLHIWSGAQWEWAHAAQLLHVAMATLAALGIMRIVILLGGSSSTGGLAAAAYLATPWTVVTGSLAYNEQAMMALGAAALALALQDSPSGARWPRRLNGLAIGLLCGFAMMVKLTAAGMIVLPIVLILVVLRRGWGPLVMLLIGASLVVAPWLIRNALATGNPVFPMFTELLGTGHWTAEQAARWERAHAPHDGPLQGLALLLSPTRGLLHAQFGYALPIAAAFGAALALRDMQTKKPAMLMLIVIASQALFWILLTHQQSRFLVPVLLPMCVLAGLALIALRGALGGQVAVAVVVVVQLAFSFAVYYRQAGGYAAQLIDGTKLMVSEVRPYQQLNRLPPGSRIYSEGFATPFYVRTPMDYHTVWDDSPLGEPLFHRGPEAAAAWLGEQGYTHLVLDRAMLSLWTSPGNYGYDPDVPLDALATLAREHLRLLPSPYPEEPVLIYQVKPH